MIATRPFSAASPLPATNAASPGPARPPAAADARRIAEGERRFLQAMRAAGRPSTREERDEEATAMREKPDPADTPGLPPFRHPGRQQDHEKERGRHEDRVPATAQSTGARQPAATIETGAPPARFADGLAPREVGQWLPRMAAAIDAAQVSWRSGGETAFSLSLPGQVEPLAAMVERSECGRIAVSLALPRDLQAHGEAMARALKRHLALRGRYDCQVRVTPAD